MGQVRQLISFTIAAVMMVTSLLGQSVACTEIDSSHATVASASVENSSADQASLTEYKHSEDSNHQNSPSHHCHCVNQVCCAFLPSEASALVVPSTEKGLPLVNHALNSRDGTPPMRPPSA